VRRSIAVASEGLRSVRASPKDALQSTTALRWTMVRLDKTNDANLQSWVTSANGHPDFPIQNLPVGIFSPQGSEDRRGGIAVGEMIMDLSAAAEAGLFAGAARDAAEASASGALNKLFALGGSARQALRTRTSELLDARGTDRERVEEISSRLLHR